ncbi:MAG: aminoacyl-tRNA hydrolase [Pseudomonadota bacterium]|nr:aminoacyl-tRNA hydrolase [Pseudomonadota bacterium]
MILIVGLGNTGAQYKNTRHNIGFDIIDSFHKKFSFPEFKSKFNGFYSKKKIFDVSVIIFKPQSFMNLSGEPIKTVYDYYKLRNTKDLFVVHDDLDMEFMKIKIKSSGGHGGHNGIRNIIKFIGQDFYRIKLGIRNDMVLKKRIDPEKFVLYSFNFLEQKEIEKIKILFNKNFKYLIEKNFSLFKSEIIEG